MSPIDVAALYTEKAEQVLAYIHRKIRCVEDADDLAMEIWQQAYQAERAFRGTHDQAIGWLYKIVRHKVCDYYRWHRELTEEYSEEWEQEWEGTPGPEDVMMHAIRLHELQDMLSKLSPMQREVLRLDFWEDLDSAAVGAQMGISGVAARGLKYRALKQLRLSAGSLE